MLAFHRSLEFKEHTQHMWQASPSMWLGSLGIVRPLSVYFACGTHRSTAGTPVPIAATQIFELSFFTGFGVSSIVYYILSWMFPVPGSGGVFAEIDVSGYEEKRMTSCDEDTNSKDGSTEKASSTV
jgi:hypothetical protein